MYYALTSLTTDNLSPLGHTPDSLIEQYLTNSNNPKRKAYA